MMVMKKLFQIQTVPEVMKKIVSSDEESHDAEAETFKRRDEEYISMVCYIMHA